MTQRPEAPVWQPSAATVVAARVEHYRLWVGERFMVRVDDYHELHDWSVEHLDDFWASIWEYFEVAGRRGDVVLDDAAMPNTRWFEGSSLNYVDQVFKPGRPDEDVVIHDRSEPGGPAGRDITRGQLRGWVAGLAATLRQWGVGPGDRVVGYLPNCAEAVAAFLATASLGAIWAGCGQDYSAPAAADRLGQLEPVVLIAADGYRYAGADHDRREAVAQLSVALGVRHTVLVSRLGSAGIDDVVPWLDAVGAAAAELRCVPVTFAHPLWVLFSSGTTGKPKGIVHGHGGVVLEHLKQAALHCDLGEDDTFFWYTSPSWMMWNYLLAGLLVGSRIVCYDGSPAHPQPDRLWQLAAELGVSVLGTSPAYLQACERAGVHPAADHDLQPLRVIGVTGSVLPPASYHWAAREVGAHVAVGAISGGTDVVSAFAGFVATVPVWAGELSVAGLGTALDAWDEAGRPVRGSVGELVVTRPMPSMPVYFWADEDGSRYRAAYFDTYPGVWRHGDWITITERGSVVIHGRSDSTLNRNGIRMGSADIYAAVEPLEAVHEALVVGLEYTDGSYWMPLFVALDDGVELDAELRTRICQAVRTHASPRHVPDDIFAVPAIPHTRTGKKLEIPVKRLLGGAALGDVVDPKSVDDPSLLEIFAGFARSAPHRPDGK
jgi:acetoacetyl-CoA synthetase